MKNLFYLLLITCLLWGGIVWADDIEIVVDDSEPRGLPYIHVVLDSSTTALEVLCTYGPAGSCTPPYMTQAAYNNLLPGHSAGDPIARMEVFSAVLSALFQDSRFSQLYVSLLLSEGENSGRVLSGYHQLGADYQGDSGAQILKGLLNALPLSTSVESSVNFQAKGAFYRWYRMVNDSSSGGSTFPDSQACSKLFSIIMATESTSEDGALDLDILSELGMSAGVGGFTDLLTKMHDASTDLVKGGLAGINALERTWVVSPSKGVDLAQDWARVGGTGRPLNLDAPAQLQRSLESAFLQALSISRIRVASGVSMTALGTAGPWSEDLFLPLYAPHATLRWAGNIKKFKTSTPTESQSSDPGQIVDVKGAQAIVATGSEKGQIVFNALSFWTETGLLPLSTAADIPFGVDGRVVSRGGAGQKIPGLHAAAGFVVGDRNEEGGARQLFLEPSPITNGSANSLVPLNADGTAPGSTAALIKPLLNVSSVGEAEQLIRWARGQDVDDEDGDGDALEARSWLMGSVIHSRPVAVNYGAVAGFSRENPNIRVFAGTGDGVFHAIENTTTTGEESGREVFGFYPNEGLASLALLRANTISSLKMRYGVDGAAATFTLDNNHDGNLNYAHPENDEAYVYFGLRRGGYSYYALDVSNPAVTPTLKWKISRDSGADFSEMGLGFSRPVIGKVNFRGEPLDVVIIGGGYHGGWDDSYTTRVGKDLNAEDDVNIEGSTGNAIYIVDARSGELVWKAIYGETTSTATNATNTQFQHSELIDSIPSSISAIKNANGTIDRLYVGDTGGSVWRVDLPVGNDPANVDHRRERWFINKLADLGRDGETTDRRFFHAPDLIRSRENDGTAFDGLLISSGNRASPNSVGVSNFHFYIKDALITSGDDAARSRAPITAEGGSGELTLADRSKCLSGGVEDSDASCSLPMENGWMIKMERPGEKGLSSPLVDGGRVFFSSYVPAQPQACTVTTGEGYLYLVNLFDGSSVEPGARIHWLGKGIPQATTAIGHQLLTPLGGIGEITQGECMGKLCKRFSSRLHKIYWREPGVDEF